MSFDKYKKERKHDTFKIDKVMKDFLQENNIEDKYEAVQVVAAWPKVMGEAINKRTIELYVKQKKLYAKLNSAPLKHQLYLGKDSIIKNYKEHFGKEVIIDIVFL